MSGFRDVEERMERFHLLKSKRVANARKGFVKPCLVRDEFSNIRWNVIDILQSFAI